METINRPTILCGNGFLLAMCNLRDTCVVICTMPPQGSSIARMIHFHSYYIRLRSSCNLYHLHQIQTVDGIEGKAK